MNYNTYQKHPDDIQGFGANYDTDINSYENSDDNYQLLNYDGSYQYNTSSDYYDDYDEDSEIGFNDFRDDRDFNDMDELNDFDDFDDLDNAEDIGDFDDSSRFDETYETEPASEYPGYYRTDVPYFNNYYPYIMPIMFELEDDDEDFSRDPNSAEIDEILKDIEINNQEVYNLLALYNVPYPVAKKVFRKVSRLTLSHNK